MEIKIADKITSVGKPKEKEKANKTEEIYLPPEKRQQITDDLKLFWIIIIIIIIIITIIIVILIVILLYKKEISKDYKFAQKPFNNKDLLKKESIRKKTKKLRWKNQ